MAYIQRLTYWLIAAAIYVLFGAVTEAHAYAPVKFYRTTYNNSIQTFSAIQPACDHAADVWSSFTGNETVNRTNCQEAGGTSTLFTYRVYFLLTDGGTTSTNIQVGNWFRACYSDPMNGTVNREPSYNCTDTPPPNCVDGRILDQGVYESDSVQIACIQSCEALKVSTGSPQISCGFSDSFGSCSYAYPAKYVDTGVGCGEGASPEPAVEPPAPQPCPMCDCFEAGQSWGQVNGVDTCVPRGMPGTPPIKTELPPTIKTDTPAPTPENPNPEPVTTVTPGPVITLRPPAAGAPAGTPPEVEQTTKNPDGSSSTVTSSLPVFCETNPNNAVCKKGNGGGGGVDPLSTWGGNCDAYSCTGDAIQCAIAKKIHEDRCADEAGLQTYSDAITRGEQLLNNELGEDVDAFIARGPEHSRNIDLPNELSETGQASLGAGGLSDLTVSVLGQAIVIPFSKLNSILEMLGFVILAVAYVSALRIVGVF